MTERMHVQYILSTKYQFCEEFCRGSCNKYLNISVLLNDNYEGFQGIILKLAA